MGVLKNVRDTTIDLHKAGMGSKTSLWSSKQDLAPLSEDDHEKGGGSAQN